MTFDDFKKQFEIFNKIDTAEKLAICEGQYKNHLLHIEDEKYFEPAENKIGDDIVSQYERNLNRILCFDAIGENQIYFLVIPSFEPEHLLILEKHQNNFTLTLITLISNYWTAFYSDNKIINTEKNVMRAELNIEIGAILFNLLDKAILQAQQPKAGGFVLDGVVYKLSKLSNGQQIIVSKHSPNEKSKPGQIIEIMQLLISNIENLNDTVLLKIETKITFAQA
jgi:hypothetical protein